jgi:hypothetical protein
LAINMQRKWTTRRGTHHYRSLSSWLLAICSHCAYCFLSFSLPPLCPFHSGQSGTLFFVMKNMPSMF